MGNKSNKLMRKYMTRKRRKRVIHNGMFGHRNRDVCADSDVGQSCLSEKNKKEYKKRKVCVDGVDAEVGQPSLSERNLQDSKKRKVCGDVEQPISSEHSYEEPRDQPDMNRTLTNLLPVAPHVYPTTRQLVSEPPNIELIKSNTLIDAVFNEYSSDLPYIVEPEQNVDYEPVKGRRIVDMLYFVNKFKERYTHDSLFDCNYQSLTLLGEQRTGLKSTYKFKCDTCKAIFSIDSEDPAHSENVDINVGAVMGVVSSGIGHSQFEEISASINLPILSKKLFLNLQDKLFDEWEAAATEEMEAAAQREKEAAIAKGRVNKDGIAVIDVYADGCWSARSYGNNYKALSGAVVIIGRRFGEVLYMAVKNKYCLICARAQKKSTTPKKHVFFKNYNWPSTGMEADIICEGFQHSSSMYNLIYGRLIADGDPATYAKILALNPYPNTTVAKIECRNHILRNLCNKLRATTKEIKYPLQFRKLLSDKKVMTVRKSVVCSIKEQKRLLLEGIIQNAQGIQNLYVDIQNSILHAFGDHRRCKEYYCSKEKVLSNAMEVTNSTFWFRLKAIIGVVASKSQSLIKDVDTNSAERFNSVIAKIIGEKRIIFSARRSYQGRCVAAVVSYNNKLPKYTLQKKFLGKSPKSSLKKMEERRDKKRQWNQKNPYKIYRPYKTETKADQNDYGANSTAPDMTDEDLRKAKEEFLENFKQLTCDKYLIQKETILQRDCCDWLELRKNMVTASNFGKIVKRRKNTSCANLIKNLLYKENLSHVASIAHGIENEQLAIQQLAKQENVEIQSCGLFIDDKYNFIGATPDGIIGDDTVVEVKCPVTAFKTGIEEATKENKVQIYKYNKKTKTYSINRNSNWFYQVQGQLHVTQRKKCLFAVWSGENQKLKTEYIERDDRFWAEKMEGELVHFYLNYILPGIIDPRHTRGLPIRGFSTDTRHHWG